MKNSIQTLSLALISSSFVAVTNFSFASDLPSKKVAQNALLQKAISWDGFYIGANSGYSFGFEGGENYCVSSGGVYNSGDCRVYPAGISSKMQASGGFIGGQFGYNLKSDQFVYGIEADFQLSNIDGSNFTSEMMFFGDQSPVAGASGADQNLSNFSTLRGRVGLLYTQETLLYATAGIMAARVEVDNYFTNLPTVYYGSAKSTKVGPVVGLGIEHKFNANWSAKIEGLYYDLGALESVAIDTCCGAPGYKHVQKAEFSGSIFRLGVNYHF